MKLSEPQVDHFLEEGYVVIQNGLTEADFAPFIRAYEAAIDQKARDLLSQNRISDLFENEPFERRLVCLAEADEETYRGADNDFDLMFVRQPAVFEFLRNPRLLDLIESILGPEITCSPIQHIRPKLPADLWDGKSSYVAPWHQDAQVHTDDADPHFILTVWIPLCDTDEDNGCLQIIPRAHRASTVYWSPGFGISPENMPDQEIVSLPMKKGDVLFLHKLMPHASELNRTDRIRWSLDLRYQKAGTPSGRSCYPDFVARSRSNPNAELRDFKTWDRLWADALQQYPAKTPRNHKPEKPRYQAVGL